MKNSIRVMVIAIITMSSGCQNLASNNKRTENTKSQNESLTIEKLKNAYIGNKLNHLPEQIGTGFSIRDSIMEGDEGLIWPAKAFFKNQTLSFYIESNWNDTIHVDRIVVVDSSICSSTGVCVGQSIRNKQYFNDKLPVEPDGYLSMSLSTDSLIYCFLDISSYDSLAYGAASLGSLPENLTIEYIVVQ